jgi:hypothetical protein
VNGTARLSALGWNRGASNHSSDRVTEILRMKLKPYIITGIVALVVVALVFRVATLRKAVTGATQ